MMMDLKRGANGAWEEVDVEGCWSQRASPSQTSWTLWGAGRVGGRGLGDGAAGEEVVAAAGVAGDVGRDDDIAME